MPRFEDLSIPTENVRHMTKIRFGTFHPELHFSKAARERIPVDPDVEEELNRGGGKVTTDARKASEKLAEVPQAAPEGNEQKQSSKDHERKTRTQKAKVKKAAARKKVTKRG